MTVMTADSEVHWPRPPVGGWTADDLDRLPDLPAHTELIDGSLVFVSPQKQFHTRANSRLHFGLMVAAPDWAVVDREMTIRIARRQRPEPDIVVLRKDAIENDPAVTWYPSFAVVLAVETISPDSEIRDRERKPELYAGAGIEHFWLADEVDGELVVSTFRLVDGRYQPTGVHEGRLTVTEPFPIDIDLTDLSRLR